MLPKTTANSHHRHTYERTTSLLGPQPARILAFGSLALAARLSSLTLLSELAGHCPASWKGLRRAPAVSHLFLAVEGWLGGDGWRGMAVEGWLEGDGWRGWLWRVGWGRGHALICHRLQGDPCTRASTTKHKECQSLPKAPLLRERELSIHNLPPTHTHTHTQSLRSNSTYSPRNSDIINPEEKP